MGAVRNYLQFTTIKNAFNNGFVNLIKTCKDIEQSWEGTRQEVSLQLLEKTL